MLWVAVTVTCDLRPLEFDVSIASKIGDLDMTQKELRIGILGANANGNWADVSHVPAINDLRGLKLAAVVTRNEQSAREAAEAFGADRWFSDPFAMFGDDRIDVVTISVKARAHRELVLAALSAGKAVYCEAPLGRTVADAAEMASAVGSLNAAIGLQGRLNPVARRAALMFLLCFPLAKNKRGAGGKVAMH
jgi:predicted dehydrogenase